MNIQIQKACQGKSKSQGGLNVSDIKDIIKKQYPEKNIKNLKRIELLKILCDSLGIDAKHRQKVAEKKEINKGIVVNTKGNEIKIKLPTKKPILKKSPETLRIVEDIVCSEYRKIIKQKLIGEGLFAKVYLHCILNNKGGEVCKYVVRVQLECNEYEYKKLEKEKYITNKLNDHGLAPKIHKIIQCREREYEYPICMTLMDYVPGSTLFSLMIKNKLTKKIIDITFAKIEELNKITIHGDLHFKNIIYQDGKIIFIDISRVFHDTPPYDDYVRLLFHLDHYCKEYLKHELCYYIYDKIFAILKPHRKDKNLVEWFDLYEPIMAYKYDPSRFTLYRGKLLHFLGKSKYFEPK